jgi:hypothetical protein
MVVLDGDAQTCLVADLARRLAAIYPPLYPAPVSFLSPPSFLRSSFVHTVLRRSVSLVSFSSLRDCRPVYFL